jgi:hypothetical protein
MKVTKEELYKIILESHRELLEEEYGLRDMDDIMTYFEKKVKPYMKSRKELAEYVPFLDKIEQDFQNTDYSSARRKLVMLAKISPDFINIVYPIIAYFRDLDDKIAGVPDEKFLKESYQDMMNDLSKVIDKYEQDPQLKAQVKNLVDLVKQFSPPSGDTGLEPLEPGADRKGLKTDYETDPKLKGLLGDVDKMSAKYARNPSQRGMVKIYNTIGDALEQNNIDAAKAAASKLRSGNNADKEIARKILSL